MRRPIKFRAWNTFTNTMSQALDFNTIVRETPRDNVHEGVILLQFTGLKDKSDVEIYEGDVVVRHTKDKTGHRYPNAAHTWIIEYEHTDKYSGFRTAHSESLEVIGNIYEHPELLKDNK